MGQKIATKTLIKYAHKQEIRVYLYSQAALKVIQRQKVSSALIQELGSSSLRCVLAKKYLSAGKQLGVGEYEVKLEANRRM